MDEKEKHDLLLKTKPSGVSEAEFAALLEEHKANCALCADNNEDNSTEGGDMDKKYTEDELNAAVNEAVASVKAELDALKAEGELDARVAEATAELEARVAELQAQLDEATVKASAAEQALNDTIAYLEAEQAAKEEAERLEALKAQRREALSDVLPEDYINEHIDRLVAMDEDTFETAFEGWKRVAAETANKKQEEGSEEVIEVPETAIKNVRDEAGSTDSDLGDILAFSRTSGVRLTSIR